MKPLAWAVKAARPDRPATAILHDEANVRVIGFELQTGQKIPPHRNDSTVLVHVVEGTGAFRGADGEIWLSAGESAVYPPGEEHSITAHHGPLRFIAILTPRPHA